MDNRTKAAIIFSLLICYGLFLGWAFTVYRPSFNEQYPHLVAEFEKSLGKEVFISSLFPPNGDYSPNKDVSLETFLNEVRASDESIVYLVLDNSGHSRWLNRYFIYCKEEKLLFEYRLRIAVSSYRLFEVKFQVV